MNLDDMEFLSLVGVEDGEKTDPVARVMDALDALSVLQVQRGDIGHSITLVNKSMTRAWVCTLHERDAEDA
jgi:hypothetical protein